MAGSMFTILMISVCCAFWFLIFEKKTVILPTLATVVIIGCSGYIIPVIAYNMEEVTYNNNEMLVELYQEQSKDLDSSFPVIKTLNPNSTVLVNHDTPIKAAMESKMSTLRSLTYAKKKKYDALVEMQKIKSVFVWVG